MRVGVTATGVGGDSAASGAIFGGWRWRATRSARSRRWTNYHRQLHQLPLFARCTRHEIRRIAGWGDAVTVEPGEVLVRQGAFTHHFLIVMSGELSARTEG